MSDKPRNQPSHSGGSSKQRSEPARPREPRSHEPVSATVQVGLSIPAQGGSSVQAQGGSSAAHGRPGSSDVPSSSNPDSHQQATESSPQREQRARQAATLITQSVPESSRVGSCARAAAAAARAEGSTSTKPRRSGSSNVPSSQDPAGQQRTPGPPAPMQISHQAASRMAESSRAASVEGGQLALIQQRVLGPTPAQDPWVEFLRREIASRQQTLDFYENQFMNLQSGRQLTDPRFAGVNYHVNWRRLDWIVRTSSIELENFRAELTLSFGLQLNRSRSGGRTSNQRSPVGRGGGGGSQASPAARGTSARGRGATRGSGDESGASLSSPNASGLSASASSPTIGLSAWNTP